MSRNEDAGAWNANAFRSDVFIASLHMDSERMESAALQRLVGHDGAARSIDELEGEDLAWVSMLVASQYSQHKRVKAAASSNTCEHLRVSVTNKEVLYVDGIEFESAPYAPGTWLHITVEMMGNPASAATLDLANAIPAKIACKLPPGVARWTHYYVVKVA